MRNKIGEAAGKVWEILGERGEINLAQLPRVLKGKSELIYQAVGWLAHENKIVYRIDDDKTFISLNEREKGYYQNSLRQPNYEDVRQSV